MSALLQLKNRGASPCLLARRPRLTLLDRTRAIPFAVPYVRRCALSCGRTHAVAPNTTLTVQPGRSAYVSFDSYRCDLGVKRPATRVEVVVGSRALAVVLPTSRPAIAWCGRGDPASDLNVSPWEPTAQLAAQRA